MAYIGKSPVIGNFVKLDAITAVNGQAAYTMQNGGSNFTDYESVNQFLVSLNGTIQAPTDSFTVSGSTLTFASNLSTGDVIDFIMVFGNSLSAGTPTDATVSTAKIVDGAVSLAKLSATGTKNSTTFLRGDNTFASAQGVYESQLLHVRDEKSAGTNGGSSSATTDNVRVINTVVTNEITGASLSSNRITLPSGTYFIDSQAHAFKSDINRLILYNHSDSSIVILGTAIYADFNYSSVGHSFLTGRFTISASKDFEIRHYTGRAVSTNGLGVSAGDSRTEVYFDAKIWKVA